VANALPTAPLAELVYFDGLPAKHVVAWQERQRLARTLNDAQRLLGRRP
jgi:hypothetical protein